MEENLFQYKVQENNNFEFELDKSKSFPTIERQESNMGYSIFKICIFTKYF